MDAPNPNRKKRRTIAAIVAVSSIAVVIFICIFSLYHLPERDPVETPELNASSDVVESPEQDFAETNDIMAAAPEQVSEMLGDLEMQYENAKLNGEPYEAQQAGMRLATAYWKAGQHPQAIECLNSLIQNYSYDTNFVTKCRELLKQYNSEPQ